MNRNDLQSIRSWRLSRRVRLILLVVIGLAIVVRLAMPAGIKWYVNHQLKRAPEYGGRIGDVSVHLWRGAYRIQKIEIFKKNGAVKEPLFAANGLDLSIEWRELLHGAVVGEVVMERPRINFVSGPTEEETQTGKNTRWDQIMESLFPFKLNRLEIRDGQVHFQNPHATPPVDIYTSEVFATATNLTNARNRQEELPAGLVARAKTLGGGGMDAQLRLNPLAAEPTFELSCQLSNVDLVSLNDFLKAYGKFDVARGTFGLYTSVAAKDGRYDGYVKTFFDNLDVFDWQKEKSKNIFGVAWEAVVGTFATVFRNQSRDSLATKVPISGSYHKNEVGVWTAAGNLLRNAFIQALIPKVDEKVTVQTVDKQAVKEEQNKEIHSGPPLQNAKAAEKTVQ